MKKITNQIIYNLKKEKSSFVSFGVIILITALILNCAAVLLSQVDRAYEEKLSSLNTADVNVIVPRIQSSSKLENNLRDLSSVEKLESHTAVMVEATVKDFNGADFSMNTVFYNMDAKRNVNNFELVSESKNDVENPIYIPLYVSDFGGFDLGDNIVYAIDGKSHSFTVAGVIEEMQYGNYGSGLLCAYLPKEDFEEFADVYSEKTVVEYSMSVNSGASLDKTKEDISKVIEHNGVMTLSLLDSESVKGARTMVTDLLILILTAFSLIILAVSVFLSNFKVKNAIDCEIINMSVLKALGYTSAQIVWGITLPYALVSLIFALSGVGLSYALLPVLCSVLTVQSGFSFAVSFDLLSFICVTVILVGVVTFFTFISARKIKKTQPIDGLRGNTSTKGAKKNRLPLDKTKGNTKLLLVLKQMISALILSFSSGIEQASSNASLRPFAFCSFVKTKCSKYSSGTPQSLCITTGLPVIKYSIVLDGKEYFVYSSESVRALTSTEHSSCNSRIFFLSTKPKNLIRLSFSAACLT